MILNLNFILFKDISKKEDSFENLTELNRRNIYYL